MGHLFRTPNLSWELLSFMETTNQRLQAPLEKTAAARCMASASRGTVGSHILSSSLMRHHKATRLDPGSSPRKGRMQV